MKILFLSRWYPFPPDNGSKIRVFNLLKNLALQHEVHLISFATEQVTTEQLKAMQRYCKQVKIVPYRSFQPGRLKAVLGFFSAQPRSFIDTHQSEMQKSIDEAVRRTNFDLVIAFEIDMMPYAAAISNVPKIVDELQLAVPYENFVRQDQPLKRLRFWLTWWKLSRYLPKLLSNFAGCAVASDMERQRIIEMVPSTCTVRSIPNGVDISHYVTNLAKPAPDTLIYAGALTFNANFEAVAFFVKEILPLIQVVKPQIKFLVTGKLDGVPLDQLIACNPNGLKFTGYLDDIRPAVAGSWLSIVPLLTGGGTRLKILESLALGTPVIATSKGAEGLNLVPGRDLLIADTPTEFAAAVLQVLQDVELRETLSRNGRRAVESQYDWTIIGRQFNDFIETTVAQARPEVQPA